MMAAKPHTSSSRIEKHTNMTLSDLLNCFSEMRKRDEMAAEDEKDKSKALSCTSDFFSHLSLEIICHVLDYLPLRDVLRMEQQCKKIQKAVSMHLRVRKSIDFTEGEIYSWIPAILNDAMLGKLISRCAELDSIYGFHSRQILKRRQRGAEMLTIPGIVAALSSAQKLKGIEVSDISLMEAILNYLPRLEILGTFKNRNGVFPINPSNKLILTSNPKITSLHLTGVVISELPRMSHVKHLYLRWVKITHSHPFRDFSVPSLQSFTMSNCAGPSSTLKYVPLITGLAAARSLTRLELIRVPFLGGLIQHIVEDSWRVNGFSQLQSVTFGACKHAQEVDLGFLMITAAHGLEGLCIQPLLTKDSLFAAIKMADVSFPAFESLHLGYVDPFPEPGKWNQEDLVMLHGLAEVAENPAMITDIGMKAIGQCFSVLRNLEIYNCPHLHFPTSWITQGVDTWSHLRHLHLRRCHAIRLQDFCRYIELLPQLELLHLEYMFREPPKGCARVGLSAGTGLGVSSALVQNNGNDGGNMDGGNHNDDDGDLNRDDNNNNANVGAAAGMGGDVNNNNEPANDIPENNNIIPEPDDDPLDEDDDFEEFSDNGDDLDFDGLSGDEENIDMANHIGDDIRIVDVAANHAACSNSQDGEASGDGMHSKSKCDNQPEKEKVECRPGTSRDGIGDPQPSTSCVYSSGLPPGCCKKRDVSMAAIPTVDSRSTCQLIDIDIGNDSDTDMESPPDGKIKVKVECNSTLEPRPKDNNQSTETKFVSSSSGAHRIIEDTSANTSGLSQASQSSMQTGKLETKETSSSVKTEETTNSALHSVTETRRFSFVPIASTSGDHRPSGEKTVKMSAQEGTGATEDDTEDSGGPVRKKKKYSVPDWKVSGGGCGDQSDKTPVPSSSKDNRIPSPSAGCSTSSRQCQAQPKRAQAQNLDEKLPKSIQCENGVASSESSLKSACFDSSSHVTGSPTSSHDVSDNPLSADLGQSRTTSSDMAKSASCHSSDHKTESHRGECSSSVSTGADSTEASVSQIPVSSCATETSKIAVSQTKSVSADSSTSSSENYPVTGEVNMNGHHKSASESQQNAQNPNSNPSAGTSGKSQETDTRNISNAELLDELAKEYDLDMSPPSSPGDNRFLFTQAEMEAMGFGKDNDSEDERNEVTKSYNMRPRKRGKSLTGKKKGLVKKRRKSAEAVKTNPKMHDKSCQAVSDEIRETTKRAKEQEESRGTSSGDNALKVKGSNSCTVEKRRTRSQMSVRCEEEAPSVKCEPFRPAVRRRKNMIDKATSTSDPVIEDDHIQVLSLRSKSLMCVTLYMVGVTDVIIDECPNLTLLRGSACRVLKKVTVGGAPKLSKVSFAQCKKIDEMHLVNEVCDQISQTNRVIYLRPMRQFDMFAFENMLFCQPDIDYHLCVIYDYSSDPTSTMYNRARITAWLDLFTGMNMELLRFMDFEQAKNFPVDEDDEEKCYRNAYIMHGYNDDGSEWTLSTDIPWLDHLSQCADVDSPDLHPDDLKEGLYCPRRKGHHLTTDCLMDLQDVISDMRNKGVSLYCYSVIVYVNMCDVSGTPTPDIYL